ncbi:MAG TPA: hypothetical protein VN805_00395 [Caulobacteraceae bacterium]|nr:hypothetical protein [Caulobacteraceae bacterium]
MAALAAACGRGNDWRTPAQSSQSVSTEASYVQPPRFTAAARLGDGDVEIVGRAHRNAHVQLTSPDGSSLAAVTDSRGAFSVAVPRSAAVRLFGLAEDVGGHQVRGVGYLAVVPSPGQPAVVLRAGTGAEALAAPSAAPKISAVDFDVSGLVVVSGLARPGSAVRLSVDGAGGVDGHANTQGRYTLTLTTALKAGDHQLAVQSPLGQAAARFHISPAGPISGLPFRGARQSNGWRIDWLTPAGGEQTTLVVD